MRLIDRSLGAALTQRPGPTAGAVLGENKNGSCSGKTKRSKDKWNWILGRVNRIISRRSPVPLGGLALGQDGTVQGLGDCGQPLHHGSGEI